MNSASTMPNQSTANQTSREQRPTSSLPSGGELQPVDDMIEYVTSYARQNPGTAALWCFGVGFIVGWRLKPW